MFKTIPQTRGSDDGSRLDAPPDQVFFGDGSPVFVVLFLGPVLAADDLDARVGVDDGRFAARGRFDVVEPAWQDGVFRHGWVRLLWRPIPNVEVSGSGLAPLVPLHRDHGAGVVRVV